MINLMINSKTLLDYDLKEYNENIKNVFSFIINNYAQNLNLSELEEIIITDSYHDDVCNVQRRYGYDDVQYTRDNGYTSCAIVLHSKIDRKTTIIFNMFVLSGLLISNSAYAIHLIHHELSHVDEKYHSQNISFNELSNSDYLIIARGLWHEYYAVRKSSNSINLNFNLVREDDVIEFLEKSLEKRDELFANIRTDDTLVMNNLALLIRDSLKMLAYLLGDLKYLEENNKDYFQLILQKLYKILSKEFIDILCSKLDMLYNAFPMWTSEIGIELLFEDIEHLFILWSNSSKNNTGIRV